MDESFTNKIVRAAGIVSTTDAGAAIGAGASAITSIQTADLNVGDLVVNQNFRSGAKIHSITNSSSLLVDRSSVNTCLLYTSPSPRDRTRSRMPSSA